ncbi:uncharacterized protein LOC131845178, partial [Achroia grisella]|uniref:uncharacterized protein LOC131845178 n=1 Tax=Achroia grisella TaxID=688607 RepID=UPI0027D20AE3
RARALRVTCRPPPRARRPPPCPAPCPAPPLTCPGSEKQTDESCIKSDRITDNRVRGCGEDRDRVARRLAAAELARRRRYEREAAADAAPRPAPRPARRPRPATDGRRYAVLPPSTPRSAASDRRVELVPDGECQIRNETHLDPCAHRPRILLEIERSKPSPESTAQTSKGSTPSTTPPRRLASRIMDGLKRTTSGTGRPERRRSKNRNRTSDDAEWCENLPKPVTVPPPCREPTLLERLRSRGSPRCNEKSSPRGKRCLHTSRDLKEDHPTPLLDRNSKGSDISAVASRLKSDFDRLNTMLSTRNRLKETERRRSVHGEECKLLNESSRISAAGRLDVPIPPGASNVCIDVALQNVCSAPIVRSKSQNEKTQNTGAKLR